MKDLLHLYSAPRRQAIITLLYLNDVGETVSVRHLARIITAAEEGTDVHRIDSEEYESAYNSMIQYHMLEFQEFEIFDYNEDRKTITVTERTHESALDFMLIKSLLR